MKFAKSKTTSSSSSSPKSEEEGKVIRTSLDCATIALKVLKTSIKYQNKLREKHNSANNQPEKGIFNIELILLNLKVRILSSIKAIKI